MNTFRFYFNRDVFRRVAGLAIAWIVGAVWVTIVAAMALVALGLFGFRLRPENETLLMRVLAVLGGLWAHGSYLGKKFNGGG